MFKSYMSRRLAYYIFLVSAISGCILAYHLAGWVRFFGWVYSLAFALSALPQCLKSREDGHAHGVANGTVILWILGEVGGLIYGIGLGEWPIIFNCGLNTIFVGIICYYKYFPRKEDINDIDN